MRSTLRIIDANANRAREALRVMEEAARFLLDDGELSSALKQLRHDLATAIANLPGIELHRDTPGDVGTTITTPTETKRDHAQHVVIAAGKRLTEALRAIEEYGKTLPKPLTKIESLRYRAYELERQLHTKLGATSQPGFKLCLLLTESLCKLPWLRVLDEAITGGVDCIQVREKNFDDALLLKRAREVVAHCQSRGVTVIINDRPDIALLAEADGVHLGQQDLPAAEVRKLVGRQLMIGVSTSNLDQAKRAREDGADYCGVGPMFHTTTKHKDTIVGPDYLAAYLHWGKLPGVAIGGITPDNIAELTNVPSVAVSACICASETPGVIAEKLRANLLP